MQTEEKAEIAELIEQALKHHDEVLEEQRKLLSVERRHVRHIKRRVGFASGVIGIIVATHHFTHIEPLGKIGGVTFSVLLSWFFEHSAKDEH